MQPLVQIATGRSLLYQIQRQNPDWQKLHDHLKQSLNFSSVQPGGSFAKHLPQAQAIQQLRSNWLDSFVKDLNANADQGSSIRKYLSSKMQGKAGDDADLLPPRLVKLFGKIRDGKMLNGDEKLAKLSLKCNTLKSELEQTKAIQFVVYQSSQAGTIYNHIPFLQAAPANENESQSAVRTAVKMYSENVRILNEDIQRIFTTQEACMDAQYGYNTATKSNHDPEIFAAAQQALQQSKKEHAMAIERALETTRTVNIAREALKNQALAAGRYSDNSTMTV
ncbi:MAG: hypothetical protein LLG04_04595 [Parachlamydia sp.]|nr:hypothetical protein [Parachlamydia sp.]